MPPAPPPKKQPDRLKKLTVVDYRELELKYEEYKDPIAYGVYAVRVPSHGVFCKDEFLMWDGSRWFYPSSDARYRGVVIGWIGPLPRLNRDDDIPF